MFEIAVAFLSPPHQAGSSLEAATHMDLLHINNHFYVFLEYTRYKGENVTLSYVFLSLQVKYFVKPLVGPKTVVKIKTFSFGFLVVYCLLNPPILFLLFHTVGCIVPNEKEWIT